MCNWIQFSDCQVWQELIFGGGGGFGADKVRALLDNLRSLILCTYERCDSCTCTYEYVWGLQPLLWIDDMKL